MIKAAHTMKWSAARYIGIISMAFILAAAAVSCKAREADVGQPAQTNLSKQENLKYVLETASQDYNKQLPKEIDINIQHQISSVTAK